MLLTLHVTVTRCEAPGRSPLCSAGIEHRGTSGRGEVERCRGEEEGGQKRNEQRRKKLSLFRVKLREIIPLWILP